MACKAIVCDLNP